MGNCNFKKDKGNTDTETAAISKNLFNLHYIIGKGGFGKVWKVEFKKSKEIYAMKIMSKFKVYQKKSITSVINEKKLLENLEHQFLVNMHYAFQDKEHIYLIMDYLGGGDLRYHIIKNFKFDETKSKFLIACLLISLEYIHTKNILHRDVKPENLVFDERGYLHLTDFGISRIWSPRNENDTSGTPGYMAPEVMMKIGHGMACDLFAVGVIAYECMLGKRPYTGNGRKEIRENIAARQARITEAEKPADWSEEAIDFVNQLLLRKQYQRLGYDKPGSAKMHPWFNDFDWQSLENKTMRSPFYGIKIEENDSLQFNKQNTGEESAEERMTFLRNQQVQKQFVDYYYDKEKLKKETKNEEKQKLLDNKNTSTINNGTTKFTTQNTIPKYG